MELVWGQYGFKKTDIQTEKKPSQEIKTDESAEEIKKLFCNFCSNFITELDAAIAINDAHVHVFSNPAVYLHGSLLSIGAWMPDPRRGYC